VEIDSLHFDFTDAFKFYYLYYITRKKDKPFDTTGAKCYHIEVNVTQELQQTLKDEVDRMKAVQASRHRETTESIKACLDRVDASEQTLPRSAMSRARTRSSPPSSAVLQKTSTTSRLRFVRSTTRKLWSVPLRLRKSARRYWLGHPPCLPPRLPTHLAFHRRPHF
jgi:hypothetical protein